MQPGSVELEQNSESTRVEEHQRIYCVVVGHFRPGSAGQRPPRVSMAMAVKCVGLWNPVGALGQCPQVGVGGFGLRVGQSVIEVFQIRLR